MYAQPSHITTHTAVWRRRCLALVALLHIAAAHGGAQGLATISGRVVHKVSKAGIAGADVLLMPGALRSVSDDGGFFRFDGLTPAVIHVVVRFLGFAPESASFTIEARDDLELLVELHENAQPLDTVRVAGVAAPLARGRLAGYYERKRFGIGKFIDGDDLEKEHLSQLGDVIVGRTPGSRLVRSRRGWFVWIATTRDVGARSDGVNMDPIDRQVLLADPRACYPDVYIDGTAVYRFNTGARLFDINSISASAVSAIEFYVGTARIPTQYGSSNSTCGVLLIWTK